MKKLVTGILVLSMVATLFACGKTAGSDSATDDTTDKTTTDDSTTVTGKTIKPLETTLDVNNLMDCTFQASFDSSDVYLNNDGALVIAMKVWDYELFDMVDISTLEVGDIIVMNQTDVTVESLDRADGTVMINGGIDEGGYNLVTDENGVYYSMGFDDIKTYYELGEAVIKVAQEFSYTDESYDPKATPIEYYAGDFLLKMQNVTDSFVPFNTTVRVENGWIVSIVITYMP